MLSHKKEKSRERINHGGGYLCIFSLCALSPVMSFYWGIAMLHLKG